MEANDTCTFWVPGIPRSKGSYDIMPRPGARAVVRGAGIRGAERFYRIRDLVLRPAGKYLEAWTNTIQATALEHRPSQPSKGPWELEIWCYFPRPKTVKPLHDERHTSGNGPDGDKLLRAFCDALTGMFWVDDGHISDKIVRLRWDDGRGPGADVLIKHLGSQQDLFA